MKQFAYALPILALAGAPAMAQQAPDDNYDTNGVQIPPYEPKPGPRAGAWEATLAGSGASVDEFDDNSFGVTGSLGYYVTSFMPVGVRQTGTIGFGSDTSDTYIGLTRAFVDFQAPIGPVQPFIGAVLGAQYGKGIEEKFVYGPEAGVKYWLNETTFVFGQGEWQAVQGKSFSDGNVVYAFGFGLNF